MRNSRSLVSAPFSGRCASWIMPSAMQRHHDLFGVVLEILANDQHRLAIAVAIGIREGDVGRQRNVAGHLASTGSGTRRACTRCCSRRNGWCRCRRQSWRCRAPARHRCPTAPRRSRWASSGECSRDENPRGGGTCLWVAEPGIAQSGTAGLVGCAPGIRAWRGSGASARAAPMRRAAIGHAAATITKGRACQRYPQLP